MIYQADDLGDIAPGSMVGVDAGTRRDDPCAGPCGIPAADDGLDQDLGWALGVLFRAYLRTAHDAFADIPGGPRGYQVLAAADRGTVTSQLALAHRLGIDRTVMTYLLDDLEGAGLIERRADPADRRARRVFATEQGGRLLPALEGRLRAAEEQLLTPLDGQARQRFRSEVQTLAVRTHEAEPVGDLCSLVETPCVEPVISSARTTKRAK
jgi:DNA-binding MarR family transcriptional regulator